MKRHLWRITLAVVLGATGMLAAGCDKAAPGPNASPAASRTGPVAAGDTPSTSAKMICDSEVAGEISARLGVQLNQQPTPTWADHVYSCPYVYAAGTMVLSVKELADAAATADYYTGMQRGATGQVAVNGLGDAAFTGPDGSVVVRKDFKVLRIDVGRLPAQFGQPPQSRAMVATTVATVIMGCWTGN